MNDKLIKAHNKRIRFNGVIYRIIAHRLGDKIVCDADPFILGSAVMNKQSERIDLVHTRSALGKSLRNLVNLGLFV